MFTFKFMKAIQAVAYLLRRESCHEMNYMRLIKILYIADRESIRQTGWPITGDRAAAMKRGPVLSEIYNLIKGCHLYSPKWSNFIQKNDCNVRLVDDPGNAALSRFDVETIERIAEEHRLHDEWDMVEYTHDNFDEWKKNDPGDECLMKWIPITDILEALDRTVDPEIEEESREDGEFERLFGN